ncbi:MAG: hypothetical protein WA996_22095 [Candidatus Promineifilaceae bacterium]
MLRTSVLGGLILLVLLAAVLSILFRSQTSPIPTVPTLADSTIHDALATQILSATVRFQINYWAGNSDESGYIVETAIGHGTVKEGRYLVTHNHFSAPFFKIHDFNTIGIYAQVQIYSASGTKLTELPEERVNIILQDEGTLVLDFGELDNLGLFDALGLTSAEFLDWHDLPVEQHIEVAQIDWDGSEARVDWTTVRAVNAGDGVTRLVIDDPLMPGASGGGVFWNGYHLANNWTTTTERDKKTGVIVGRYSSAALNSSQIASLGAHQPNDPNASLVLAMSDVAPSSLNAARALEK